MVVFAIVFITYIKTSVCIKLGPGVPVPNADILDRILTRQLGAIFTKNTIFDFILGNPIETNGRRNLNDSNDNLGISILDVDNVKHIVEVATKEYEKDVITRRDNVRQAYWIGHKHIVNQTHQIMIHEVYQTKDRIKDTIPFRNKYKDNHSYIVAVLYGASTAILTKMEILMGQMNKFGVKTHFIWYLIVYEKMLACNIDVTNNIEKLFLVHEAYTHIRGPKAKKKKGSRGTPATLPPNIAQILVTPKLPL